MNFQLGPGVRAQLLLQTAAEQRNSSIRGLGCANSTDTWAGRTNRMDGSALLSRRMWCGSMPINTKQTRIVAPYRVDFSLYSNYDNKELE